MDEYFISYPNNNRGLELAKAIKQELKEQYNIDAFVFGVDKEKYPGMREDELIEMKIEECKHMIVIFTKGAKERDWIYGEVRAAYEKGKDTIPCREKGAEVFIYLEGRIPLEFSDKNELLLKIKRLIPNPNKYVPNKSPLIRLQPYIIDGDVLTFGKFISMLRDGKLDAEDGITDIAFVFGTTRHEESKCEHPGYISDALYIPEIASEFIRICGRNKVRLHSFLDVDLWDREDLKRYNLILTGDGEVNYVSSLLLKEYKDTLVVKYLTHVDPFFDSIFGKWPTRKEHHNYGTIHLLRNPWNKEKDRIVILCAGIGPIGTVAALKKLKEILQGGGSDYHTYVVKGEEKEYPKEFCKEEVLRKLGIEDGHYEGKLSNVKYATTIREFP